MLHLSSYSFIPKINNLSIFWCIILADSLIVLKKINEKKLQNGDLQNGEIQDGEIQDEDLQNGEIQDSKLYKKIQNDDLQNGKSIICNLPIFLKDIK